MIFQHKDGELRLYEHGRSVGTATGVTHYFEILFVDANLTTSMGRAQTEERMVLNRGVLDSNAHYVEGGDASRLEPLALTFSCKAADTNHTQYLLDAMSGVTQMVAVGGTTYALVTRSGKGLSTDIYGLSTALPAFKDGTYKMSYKVEVLYSGTSNWGYRFDQVYFPPAEQTITEAEDALTLNLNGQVYGGVTTITSFHADITSGDTVTAIT